MTWAFYFSDDLSLRQLMYWLMGSIGGASWYQHTVTLVMLPVLIWLCCKGKSLDKSPKQTQALYNHWLEVNESAFSKSAGKIDGWQAIVFGTEGQGVTKEKLKALGVKTCFITGDIDKSTLEENIARLDDQVPTLLLNGGDSDRKSVV